MIRELYAVKKLLASGDLTLREERILRAERMNILLRVAEDVIRSLYENGRIPPDLPPDVERDLIEIEAQAEVNERELEDDDAEDVIRHVRSIIARWF
ncbi:MAG: hypothetical protein RML84_11410 [Anaerolineae bacterium]|nr:hypothetical protein [Anaerolineae bacterium]